MPTFLLTKEKFVTINKTVVKLSGDPHGVMNEGNLQHLEQALALKYSEDPDKIILKAAFLRGSNKG